MRLIVLRSPALRGGTGSLSLPNTTLPEPPLPALLRARCHLHMVPVSPTQKPQRSGGARERAGVERAGTPQPEVDLAAPTTLRSPAPPTAQPASWHQPSCPRQRGPPMHKPLCRSLHQPRLEKSLNPRARAHSNPQGAAGLPASPRGWAETGPSSGHGAVTGP